MARRLGALLVVLTAVGGCRSAAFVPDGALARPLTEFDRIDVRALENHIPGKGDAQESKAPSPDFFLQQFRKDLTTRLRRVNVFTLTSGPVLVLNVSLLKYECESLPHTFDKDALTDRATIDVSIVLTDESGKRLGAGKASVTYPASSTELALRGAEKRIVTAIRDYLKKGARGKASDAHDPDDNP